MATVPDPRFALVPRVASIAVFPGIGIARVGNSPYHFIGPEAPGIQPDPGPKAPGDTEAGGPGVKGGYYKDTTGRMKPQAARFRVYGLDANGTAIMEITSDIADISWDVHMVNMKAANWAFQGEWYFDPTKMRNSDIQPPAPGADGDPTKRDKLIIDPGVKTISGNKQGPVELDGGRIFDGVGPNGDGTGLDLPGELWAELPLAKDAPRLPRVPVTYTGTAVSLGKLYTDDAGRLIIVGGEGRSECCAVVASGRQQGSTVPIRKVSAWPEQPQSPEDKLRYGNGSSDPMINEFSYFNAPGWFDDTGGGPVNVRVAFKNAQGALTDVTHSTYIDKNNPGDGSDPGDEAKRGWVAVAPPKFSPWTYHVVSLLDLMQLNFPAEDPWQPPAPVDFYRDIYPTLAIAVNYAWVSEQAFGRTGNAHGPSQPGNVINPEWLELMSQPRFADPDKQAKADNVRFQIYNILRKEQTALPPAPPKAAPVPKPTAPSAPDSRFMPLLWGSGGLPGQNTELGFNLPNQFLSLTDRQLQRFEEWQKGNFVTGTPIQPKQLKEYSIADQPRALNFAALEPTIGGGFHPGIEITYIVNYPSFVSRPFRVAQDRVAGSVAAFMSVPWQGDFWSCNVQWWPVQRPEIVVDFNRDGQRATKNWFRGPGIPEDASDDPNYQDGYDTMVDIWWKLGLIAPTPASEIPPGADLRNETAYREVERDPGLDGASVAAADAAPAAAPSPPTVPKPASDGAEAAAAGGGHVARILRALRRLLGGSAALAVLTAALLLAGCESGKQEVTALLESEEAPQPNQTEPKPTYQRMELAKPLPEGDPKIGEFLAFFNNYTNQPLPAGLTKNDIVWMPPASLGAPNPGVWPAAKNQGFTPNYDPPNTYPNNYPIVSGKDATFHTSDICQDCHDSSKIYSDDATMPHMSYLATYEGDTSKDYIANLSMYGEWSVSIMGLAARDPVWHAQIETETSYNKGVPPHYIETVCFRCHGAMGEKQLRREKNVDFFMDLFYTVLPNHGYGERDFYGGAKYENTTSTVSTVEARKEYAIYGALARDNVSCEVCHRIGPESGTPGSWDGTDYEVFYGPTSAAILPREDPPGPPNPLTANFQYSLNGIVTPDRIADVYTKPMIEDEDLAMSQAINKGKNLTYLRQGVLCGACHTLIVPKIPTAYRPNGPVPDDRTAAFPNYKRPEGGDCPPSGTAATFLASGNAVDDPCVALAYEQTTYYEWLNSRFGTEDGDYDTATTCQGCHMPKVTSPSNSDDHTSFVCALDENSVKSPDKLTRKNFRRHRMMGINLFVFEMFEQFPDVLGVTTTDNTIPVGTNFKGQPFIQDNLLNGQMNIVLQATKEADGTGKAQAAAEVTIESSRREGDQLVTSLTVANNTGHKFPSGAGFRRAFIKFEVLDDAGEVLWVSGDFNAWGAICDGPCRCDGPNCSNILPAEFTTVKESLQPHYQTISAQNQVQIYESREVDDKDILTSRTLSLFEDVKDNRIPPQGAMNKSSCTAGTIFGIDKCQLAAITEPYYPTVTVPGGTLDKDRDYASSPAPGVDAITYSIPLTKVPGAASVRATLHYQTVPPGTLVGRFNQGYDKARGDYRYATKRLIYLASNLNLDLGLHSEHPDNPDLELLDGWTMAIHQDTAEVN